VSNWAGQFYADAPIGNADQVTVTATAFLTNTTSRVVKSASYTIFNGTMFLGPINLTGEAVVAGVLVTDPYIRPVAGATVQVCRTVQNQAVGSAGLTNVSGSFWILAPPGPLTMTISATDFVSQVSYVQACSDCWVWGGRIVLSSYGSVAGNVRGLPSGFPL